MAEILVLSPAWNRKQRETNQKYRKLGIQFGHYPVQMHGEDRAEMSSIWLLDAKREIKEAVVSGRLSWVIRSYELHYFGLGLAQRYRDLLDKVQIKEIIADEVRPFLTEVGFTIVEHSPYQKAA